MAPNLIADSRDVRFVLFEMLEADKLNKYERYSSFDRDVMEDTLNLAENIAVEQMYPLNETGDREHAKYFPETKEVKLPKEFHSVFKTYCEAGFISLRYPEEAGGVGMPYVVSSATKEILNAANPSLIIFPGLSEGVAEMIYKKGTEEQKKIYLGKLLTGQWGATMCLTEADAGSDVGNLKTKAKRQPDGTYLIEGQKIFITGCDQDLTENIVHTVLARIEGDPAGTKGISIFIVPKYLVNKDGSLGSRNDIYAVGLEHKMGINSSATGTLALGENGKCVGYLLGQEREGMKVMFLLMNEARIGVGLQSLAISSTAYMHSIPYAKNRVQGADFTRMMEANPPKVAIINHPDVKRMLLWMKSYVEGMRMLCYFLAYNVDLEGVMKGHEAEEAQNVVELLTPIVKAGNSDMAWLITAEAMQVYGGYGYTQDYRPEQFARDSKINSIYEGANGIQALDLAMRKILMNKDQVNYKAWRKRVDKTIASAKGVVEDRYIELVDRGAKKLDEVITYLNGHIASGKFLQIACVATPLLKIMHDLALAWLHLWSLTLTLPKMKALTGDKKGDERKKLLENNNEAAYYTGRVLSSQFFIGTEFPKFFGRVEALMFGDTSILRAENSIFTGAPDDL